MFWLSKYAELREEGALEYFCQVGTRILRETRVHHYGWNVLDKICSLKFRFNEPCSLKMWFIDISSSRI